MSRLLRWRAYVREIIEDALHAAGSWIIAFVLLGIALYYKVNLTTVLNFNLVMLDTVTEWIIPYGYGGAVAFAMRMGGADHVIFFSELWAFAAVVIRVVGLSFRLAKRLVSKPFRRRN